MITSIEMKNFRGIVQGKLEDLTPLVILVGPNASGKSTVLDALLIGASPNVGEGIAQAVLRHRGVKFGAPWLLWKTEKGAGTETRATTATASRQCELLDAAQSTIRCRFLQEESGTAAEQETLRLTFSAQLQIINERYGYVATPTPLPDVTAVRILGPLENPIAATPDRLLTECIKAGKRPEMVGYLRELAPAIRDVLILTEDDGSPIVHIEYSDRSVPVALAGDGYLALVRALLEMVNCSDGLVLYEEPEVHQHPAALRQTVRAILAATRRNVQVVLTTHSLELIDFVIAESTNKDLERTSLYQLKLENGNLIAVRHPGGDVAFARTQIEDDLR